MSLVSDRVLPATMGQWVDRTSLGATDFDGDGHLDLAIREPETTARGVRIFYQNGDGGFSNASSSEVTSTVAPIGDFFGMISAVGYHPSFDLGDVDGDGIGDLLAGAVEAGPSINPSAGLVYGRPGRASDIDWTGSAYAAVLSPAPNSPPGNPPLTSRLVGLVGDMDLDGFEDVVVTDHRATGSSPSGRVFVLH